jgi:hypothetical protein
MPDVRRAVGTEVQRHQYREAVENIFYFGGFADF